MGLFVRVSILMLLFPAVLFAQGTPQGAPATQSNPSSLPQESGDAIQLSLEEAVSTAVQRNLGVELERYDFRMAGWDARGAYAPFDFFTTGTASTSNSSNPTFLPIVESSQSEFTRLNLAGQQTLATGGTYSLSFNNNLLNEARLEEAGVTDVYGSDFGFDFTQPLLRNFGVDVNRRGVNIARNTLAVSGEAFRDQLIRTVLAVEQAYWDLIYQRQELDVRRQSLTLARDQERITQIRIDVGASAPLDILQPRVAIATRDEEVILAEAGIRDAEDRLRQLMNLPPEQWDRPIVPTDSISYEPAAIDTANAVSRAMELRPEIRQVGLLRDTNRIRYVFARNQVLPRADLQLQYGLGGEAAGSQIIRDPITGEDLSRSAGIGDAFEQVFGRDFESWTVGVNFGLPIRNIGARAEARRAELDLGRSQREEALVRQNIAVEVRQAIRDIDTAQRSIAATRAARDAAERNLEAERRRFENGMTTNFNVLLIQQDLANARSREIFSQAAYRQALANYHRAVGDILEVHNITVAEPERFTLPASRFERVNWLQYSNYMDEAPQDERNR